MTLQEEVSSRVLIGSPQYLTIAFYLHPSLISPAFSIPESPSQVQGTQSSSPKNRDKRVEGEDLSRGDQTKDESPRFQEGKDHKADNKSILTTSGSLPVWLFPPKGTDFRASPFQGEKSISIITILMASMTRSFNPSPEEVEDIPSTN